MSLRACDFFFYGKFGAPRIVEMRDIALVIPCLFVVYRWTAHPNVAGRPVPEQTHTVYVCKYVSRASLFHLREFPCVFVVVGTEQRKPISRLFDLCASDNTHRGEDKEPLESSRESVYRETAARYTEREKEDGR